jgi:hypothetical protein
MHVSIAKIKKECVDCWRGVKLQAKSPAAFRYPLNARDDT